MTKIIPSRKIIEVELLKYAKPTQFIYFQRVTDHSAMDFSKIETAELEAELSRRQGPTESWVDRQIRLVNDELARRELTFEDLAKMTNPQMQSYHISQILNSKKICRMDIFARLIEALGLHKNQED